MEELGEITKSKDVSLDTKAKAIHTLIFPITMYGCESQTVKKADRGKNDSFEMWCWRKAIRIPQTTRKMNKQVLEQIKPETFAGEQNGKTEAILLWAYHQKVVFFARDNNAGKNRRQQKKMKTKYEIY